MIIPLSLKSLGKGVLNSLDMKRNKIITTKKIQYVCSSDIVNKDGSIAKKLADVPAVLHRESRNLSNYPADESFFKEAKKRKGLKEIKMAFELKKHTAVKDEFQLICNFIEDFTYWLETQLSDEPEENLPIRLIGNKRMVVNHQ